MADVFTPAGFWGVDNPMPPNPYVANLPEVFTGPITGFGVPII
jgi:hypothetical protein